MATLEDHEGHAFAESVRRQALRIASLIQCGKTQEAAEAALALCSASQRRKRQIAGLPEPPDVDVDDDRPHKVEREQLENVSDSLDLGELRRQFGTDETE